MKEFGYYEFFKDPKLALAKCEYAQVRDSDGQLYAVRWLHGHLVWTPWAEHQQAEFEEAVGIVNRAIGIEPALNGVAV